MIGLIRKLVPAIFILLNISYSTLADEDATEISFRIVGGFHANIKDYPYLVAILLGEKFRCGGSIISSHHILTAAACTEDINPNALTIRAGSHRWNTGGQVRQVLQKFEHPEFVREQFLNDIAVIKLKTPLVFNDVVRPLQLAEPNMGELPEGTMATIAGWGKQKYDSKSMSEELMVAHVPTVDRDECVRRYETTNVTETMLCAGYPEEGRGTCIGDGGSPLTINHVQIGILSWGTPCALANSPGVYTSVKEFRDFIDEIARRDPDN